MRKRSNEHRSEWIAVVELDFLKELFRNGAVF